MFKIFLIIAVVLIFATGFAHADSEKISGFVTEDISGYPIPYVSVLLDGTNLGTVADSIGYFIINHVPTGDHSVIISAVGFEARHLTVTVTKGIIADIAISLKTMQIDIGNIVVTGTRTPRYVKDVPIFTEVVSKASIDDKSAHNIFEALEGEAGVRVEQQCQGCNFSILRMQGLGADHTQVLLDGQPIYSGLAGVYGLQQMSTADVEQIEIVKGAGSALYGSNAIAGAINILSSIPRKTEGRVNIEIGEHGTNKYDVSASASKDKLGIFLFAQQSEQDELDETGDINAVGGVNNPDGWIDRVRLSAKNAGCNLFLENLFSNDRLVFRGRLLSETRSGGWLTNNQFENPFAPASERIITDRYSSQLEYRLWLPHGTELNLSLVLSNHKRNATNDTFLSDYEEAFGITPPIDLLRPYLANEDLLITNFSLTRPLGKRHRLLVGTQFSHNHLEESGMYLDIDSQEPYKSISQKTASEFGAYIQGEIKLSPKVEIVAGVRFDYHTSEDEFRGSGNVIVDDLESLEYQESSINPRFSVKYSPNNDLVFRSSIGTGFRVPYGFSEDLHLCSGSPRVYKGGKLKPEKSFSYSFSMDYTKSKFTSSVNLYRTKLIDAIAFADSDADVADLGYTYQWENIDNAYVMGAEFNGSVALTRSLTAGARFEIFEGKYDKPREDWVGTAFEKISRNISRFPQISSGFKIDYSVRKWNLIIDADYKGKMYIDLAEPVDPANIKIHETESFILFNTKLNKTIFERYNIYVGAKNITNYTQEEKHIDDAAFLYAPVYGRLFYGGIQISL